MTIREQCERLHAEALLLATDVDLIAALSDKGLAHVNLLGAQLAITRAKEAIDRVAAKAERIWQKSAPEIAA